LRTFIASLAALSLAAGANAQTPAPPAQKSKAPVEVHSVGKGMAGASRVQTLTATVKAINAATREITLEAKGKTQTVKAGPAVKRFDEIAVGDTVSIRLEQGLLLEYQPPGSETVEPTAVAASERGPADKAPAGAVAAGVQATVTVTAIDLPNRMVVFQGPQGNIYQVKAGPKVQLEKLKVGDKLLATYAEAVAVKLEKKAPAKAPAAKETTKK
jgi:hypothetical protein